MADGNPLLSLSPESLANFALKAIGNPDLDELVLNQLVESSDKLPENLAQDVKLAALTRIGKNAVSDEDLYSLIEQGIGRDKVEQSVNLFNDFAFHGLDLVRVWELYERMAEKWGPLVNKSLDIGGIAYQAIAFRNSAEPEVLETLKSLLFEAVSTKDFREKIDPLQVSAITYSLITLDSASVNIVRSLDDAARNSVLKLAVDRNDLKKQDYAKLLDIWFDSPTAPQIGYNLFFKADSLDAYRMFAHLKDADSSFVKNFVTRSGLDKASFNDLMDAYSADITSVVRLLELGFLSNLKKEEYFALGKFVSSHVRADRNLTRPALEAYKAALWLAKEEIPQRTFPLEDPKIIAEYKDHILQIASVLLDSDGQLDFAVMFKDLIDDKEINAVLSPRARALQRYSIGTVEQRLENLMEFVKLMDKEPEEKHADAVRVYNEGMRLLEKPLDTHIFRLFDVFYLSAVKLHSEQFMQRAANIAQRIVDSDLDIKNLDLLTDAATRAKEFSGFVSSVIANHQSNWKDLYHILKQKEPQKAVELGFLILDASANKPDFGMDLVNLASEAAPDRVDEVINLVNNGSPAGYETLKKHFKDNDSVLKSLAQSAVQKGYELFEKAKTKDAYALVVTGLVDLCKFEEAYEFADNNKFIEDNKPVDRTNYVSGNALSHARKTGDKMLEATAYMWREDTKKRMRALTPMVAKLLTAHDTYQGFEDAIKLVRKFGADPSAFKQITEGITAHMDEAEMQGKFRRAYDYASLGLEIEMEGMGEKISAYSALSKIKI